jgi:hypothetical protein
MEMRFRSNRRKVTAISPALGRGPRPERARFGDAQIAELHRVSGGVPRSVHRLATAVLRATAPGAPGPPDPLLDAD